MLLVPTWALCVCFVCELCLCEESAFGTSSESGHFFLLLRVCLAFSQHLSDTLTLLVLDTCKHTFLFTNFFFKFQTLTLTHRSVFLSSILTPSLHLFLSKTSLHSLLVFLVKALMAGRQRGSLIIVNLNHEDEWLNRGYCQLSLGEAASAMPEGRAAEKPLNIFTASGSVFKLSPLT